MFNNFRPPHLPQTHVDGSVFLSDELSLGENITILKVVRCRKKLSTGNKTKLKKKSFNVAKKPSTGNETKF